MAVLSVVIPAYNMEQWLAPAIESCLYQTHRDVEVLVVNDGSTDKSGAIADRYAKLDSRVRHIYQTNAGSGAARQKGQDEATGDFITWLDADDFLAPHAAKVMLETAERDKVDLVCGNATVFSDKTFNTRHYFPHPAASRLNFADAPRYWKSKVLWRWIFSLPFLRTGKDGAPFTHASFKLGQDVCFMFEVLPRVEAFSQCRENVYFFRQEHKSAHSDIETCVEHELAHFIAVKQLLLGHKTPQIKPLIKYLNENYWRDVKAFAPRLSPHVGLYNEKNAIPLEQPENFWQTRALILGQELFDGLDPQWFSEEFLAPELKP
ncbi:MAG: glycosyltransferase family 2 protein, partial [Bilophila sp.]